MATVEDRLVINVTRDLKSNLSRQHPKREDRYEIHEFDESPVLYFKWESPNVYISDTLHDLDSVWYEEFTDIPEALKARTPKTFTSRIDADGDVTEEPLNLEDGCILCFEGRYTRDVAILNGEILGEEAAQLREETSESELPRFHEWAFRIVKVVVTDGPAERERIGDTQDQKRNRAETRMFDSQQEFFNGLMTRMGGAVAVPTDVNLTPQSASDVFENVDRSLAAMDDSEKKRLLTLLVSELEEEVQLDVTDDDEDDELTVQTFEYSVEPAAEKKKPVKKAAKKAVKK